MKPWYKNPPGVRPVRCDVCAALFADYHVLAAHVHDHHPERPAIETDLLDLLEELS